MATDERGLVPVATFFPNMGSTLPPDRFGESRLILPL